MGATRLDEAIPLPSAPVTALVTKVFGLFAAVRGPCTVLGMSLQSVADVVGSTPYMKPRQAQIITDLIREYDLKDVLELGIMHGVSTCYIADTLRDLGGGHVTSLDLDLSRDNKPDAETLLKQLGLMEMVTIRLDPTSYVWTLMKMLEEDPAPRYDLCYLDGAHDWFADGFAFFLVDKILRPGGWLVFDDISWSFATSPALAATDRVQEMPLEQRNTQQVRKVYDLLVKTHPSYAEFKIVDDWGMARKRTDVPTAGPTRIVKEIVVERERYGAGALVREAAGKVRRKLRSR